MDRFWIVMQDVNQLNATYRHSSLEKAQAEAERLSKLTGNRFLVLELVSALEVKQVVYLHIEEPIPF